MGHSLKQFTSLTSQRVNHRQDSSDFNHYFSDPVAEVYLMFFQSVLLCFTHSNWSLQREKPLIYLLQPQLEKLLKSVL